MNKKFFYKIILLLFSITNLFGQTQQIKNFPETKLETITLPIVAKVGNRNITSQEFFNRLLKENGLQVLNQMILEILIEEEAKKLNIQANKNEIEDRLNNIKKQFRNEAEYNSWLQQNNAKEEDLIKQIQLLILQEKLVIKSKNISVSEKEIRDFFDSNKDQLGIPEQVRCRHILLKTKEQAEDILLALRAGADFAVIARAKSEDVNSKESGGDLGYITRGMLLPQLEEIIFNLKVGEISDPIETNLGYHIIKVEDKKITQPAKFDKETKERIRKFLLQQKISSQTSSYLEELRNKTEIVIY